MTADDSGPYEAAPPEIVRAMGGRVPTVQQWRAISHPLSPCSVVAGAGSGKTAVMAARVVYLTLVGRGRLEADHRGTLPSQILCLTFTNKAAEELSRRVREAVGGLGLPEGEEPTVLTYHAFAAGLLEDFGLRMGVEAGPSLLTEAQKWQLALGLLAEREFEHLEVRTHRTVVAQVLDLADQCANHLVEPEEVLRHSRDLAGRIEVRRAVDRQLLTAALRRQELAEMVAAYRDRKRGLGAIDYGDQIALAHRLVEEHPEVARAFRERFSVVLLDEYQDTNVAQARLLSALVGRGYPVFAVGDPDQSIYAWRGATLWNILRFGEEFGGRGGAEQRPLYVNFRSGSRILAVADRVIEEVPEGRRAPGKELRPHPPRGEGVVQAFVAADAHAEARQIAEMIREEAARRADGGEPRWDEFAVLCRKKRLFGPIAEALREAGVPAEVVDLGGLLTMPEAVEVLAWLRVLENPADNVALARILLGPRWRIGYRDLVALARWSTRENREMALDLEAELSPGDVRFALLESLDHLDDEGMGGLSDEARARLEEFRGELAALREASRGSLGDLVAEVAERSGLLRELETAEGPAAVSARRNLLNLADHVAAFSPIEGEASLATLIDYLDMAQEAEDELEPAQLSDANTVKLMTIHKAKGLEWPVVFVPGLAEHEDRSQSSIFPDLSRQSNPLTQAWTLPFELRGDADDLPRFRGDVAAFRNELRDRAQEEERRLCYVALTRAMERLVVSSAYWYEGPSKPHRPGRFLEEVAGHPACEVLFRDDCPGESPLVDRRRVLAVWPREAHRPDADDLFPEGWHAAAVEAVRDPASVEGRVEALPPEERERFRRRRDDHAERAALIGRRTRAEDRPPPPASLSVSSVVDYLRCPKLFYWSQVRPLPRRPSDAARLGSEVHRWIELESTGQAALLDVDQLPDLSTDERLAEPGPAEAMRRSFRESRFAERVPLHTERPFLLYLDGIVVGGRIDAVFGEPDGAWEVVDYKTGKVPDPGDELVGLQLDLYALACIEVWGKRPEDLTLTYFYLAEGKEDSRPAGDPAETRARVAEALRRIREGEFDPTPGPQCRWCDFLAFCEAGRASLGES